MLVRLPRVTRSILFCALAACLQAAALAAAPGTARAQAGFEDDRVQDLASSPPRRSPAARQAAAAPGKEAFRDELPDPRALR
jgi:hypothetical protein